MAALTLHVGWTSRETYERFFAGAVANLQAYFDGAPAQVINPEAVANGRP